MLQNRLLLGLLLLLGVTSQKDEDEGRPYEFGFTIDGEQHRYEKKDINGIIQGEFGFITGDGVYHVTVYATDENGSFKILSMKNIKVSEPLDRGGKPSTAGLVRQPISNQQPSGTIPLQPPSPSLTPLQPNPPSPPPSIVKPTSRPVYDFTTASTVRNGCSGCGIVTTPNAPFSFQNPAFQRPSSNGDGSLPGLVRKPFVPSEQSTSYPKPPPSSIDVNQIKPPQTVLLAPGTSPPNTNIPQAGISVNQPSPVISIAPQGRSLFVDQPKTDFSTPSVNQPNLFDSINTPGLPTSNKQPSPLTPINQPNPIQSPNPNYQSDPLSPINPAVPLVSVRPVQSQIQNEIPVRPVSNPVFQAKVEGGIIKIPGSEPIQIRDKYPNMVDGLPEGITEKDITDILYKFNYTLGFHGHYEKGLRNGTKIGGYFVNGRDGISRVVTYVADENGYRPKVTFINLGLDSEDTPKPDSEKKFGLKNFEFVWYPVKS